MCAFCVSVCLLFLPLQEFLGCLLAECLYVCNCVLASVHISLFPCVKLCLCVCLSEHIFNMYVLNVNVVSCVFGVYASACVFVEFYREELCGGGECGSELCLSQRGGVHICMCVFGGDG